MKIFALAIAISASMLFAAQNGNCQSLNYSAQQKEEMRKEAAARAGANRTAITAQSQKQMAVRSQVMMQQSSNANVYSPYNDLMKGKQSARTDHLKSKDLINKQDQDNRNNYNDHY
jgi:hypothetical protein